MTPATKRTVNSCLRCRGRKIRCSRERPECQNCARHGHSCRYAPTPSEATSARPEAPGESYKELAQRLSHLETVVARLAGAAPESSPPEGSAISSASDVHVVDREPRLLPGSYWKQLAAQVRNSFLDAQAHCPILTEWHPNSIPISMPSCTQIKIYTHHSNKYSQVDP